MSCRQITSTRSIKRGLHYYGGKPITAHRFLFTMILAAINILCGSGCGGAGKTNEPLKQFFKNPFSAKHFGGDGETRRLGNYQSIWYFCVDDSGHVYVADQRERRLDKYDPSGRYMHSIGGKNDPSNRFPDWFKVFSADTEGTIHAYSVNQRQILKFSAVGAFLHSFHLPNHFNHWYPRKMIAGDNGELYILGRTEKDSENGVHIEGYQLVRLHIETGEYFVIHSDYKRTLPSFKDMQPDFDLDADGNLHIVDSIEYMIYIYLPSGALKETFSKKAVKPQILENDFHVLIRPMKIEKITSVERDLKRMKGPSKYFPAVFGINIDGNRIYTWTSRQDADKKYLVDVYDMSYNYICSTSHYNFMGTNIATIKNGVFYMPNIGSEDYSLKQAVGRFSYFNVPHRIEAHRIQSFGSNEKE